MLTTFSLQWGNNLKLRWPKSHSWGWKAGNLALKMPCPIAIKDKQKGKKQALLTPHCQFRSQMSLNTECIQCERKCCNWQNPYVRTMERRHFTACSEGRERLERNHCDVFRNGTQVLTLTQVHQKFWMKHTQDMTPRALHIHPKISPCMPALDSLHYRQLLLWALFRVSQPGLSSSSTIYYLWLWVKSTPPLLASPQSH